MALSMGQCRVIDWHWGAQYQSYSYWGRPMTMPPRRRLALGQAVTNGDERHRHGAAADHFMTHLSVTEGETDSDEHVTDTDPAA
jgi:hypothetical protein